MNTKPHFSRPSPQSPPADSIFSYPKSRFTKQSLAALLRSSSYAGCLFIASISAAITSLNAAGYTLTFPNTIQINGPAAAADPESWLAAMQAFRTQQRALLTYDDSVYRYAPLAWTQHNPVQPQVMAHDRSLYDPNAGKYTVSKFLADVRSRYGGVDSVLIWPTYPNIGVDSRNFDQLIRDMPGFPDEVRQMVNDFHKNGVRVLFPLNPWDNGTHYPGAPWSEVLPETMAEIGADGMNGDTMDDVPNDYFDSSLIDKNPLAFEPELGCTTGTPGEVDPAVQWNTMGWGYWATPYNLMHVSMLKWFEPRFSVHVCDRWSISKIGMLQAAFFNGTGIESWENVWGTWNQLTDRDCQAIRCAATVEREFPDLLVSQGWVPYAATINSAQVFASEWPSQDNSETLWTIVNVGANPVNGDQISVPYQQGTNYYDLWNGFQLQPKVENGVATLSFTIEGNGFGAILATNRADTPRDLQSFLATMRNLTARPLASYSDQNIVAAQTMDRNPTTKIPKQTPTGMIKIPGGSYQFIVGGTEIEGFGEPGVDVQYPWEPQPTYNHNHAMTIAPFYLDRTEVTNAQYQAFMDATNYQPADSHNFLKDWDSTGSGRPHFKKGWDNKPVTWVSVEDAQAYAKWAGRRLPNEWEWQYAAQGTDSRPFPWGYTFSASNVPPINTSRDVTPPADVNAYPGGASPFGVLDMVGNVWQWTNTFTDPHTRAAVVRGGSPYEPQTSIWYFPSIPTAYQLNNHNKYLLMAPSLDRSAEIGFRTAADAPAYPPGQTPPPPTANSISIEAESLTPLSSANGPYSVQTDIPLYPFVWWTGGAQVWMSSKTAGENYTFTFDVSTSGAYHLILAYTLAHDYGIFTQSIDGQTISTPTDGYSSILTLGYRDCGPVQLNAGTHALTLTVIGKNSSAISYGMGLDRIILTEPQTTADPVIGTALSGQ
jgi:gamma-glutamyl hercynylcysteine S-oxide synthase